MSVTECGFSSSCALPAAAEADYALLRRETVGALGKALKPHLPAASEHA